MKTPKKPPTFIGASFRTRGLDELRSKGAGPWSAAHGKPATFTIEPGGREMVFLNGGPAQQLNPLQTQLLVLS